MRPHATESEFVPLPPARPWSSRIASAPMPPRRCSLVCSGLFVLRFSCALVWLGSYSRSLVLPSLLTSGPAQLRSWALEAVAAAAEFV